MINFSNKKKMRTISAVIVIVVCVAMVSYRKYNAYNAKLVVPNTLFLLPLAS